MVTVVRADKSICRPYHFLFNIRKLKFAVVQTIKNQISLLQSNCGPLLNLVNNVLLFAPKMKRSNSATIQTLSSVLFFYNEESNVYSFLSTVFYQEI